MTFNRHNKHYNLTPTIFWGLVRLIAAFIVLIVALWFQNMGWCAPWWPILSRRPFCQHHSFIRFLGATLSFWFEGSLKYLDHIFSFFSVYLFRITDRIRVRFWCLIIYFLKTKLWNDWSQMFSLCLNVHEKLVKIHQVLMNLKYWILIKKMN